MTDDVRRPGMIADVSLRLLYLIFQKALGLFLLMGRMSANRRPGYPARGCPF